MLFPKKVKYRKWHTMRKNMSKKRVATRGTHLSFGSFGLRALTGARIRSNQIEASRKAAVRILGKTGKMWIRIFPDFPYTAKAAEVGMGKGKGDPAGYQCEVFPGRILLEVDGLPEKDARTALRKASGKLPVKTVIVARGEV